MKKTIFLILTIILSTVSFCQIGKYAFPAFAPTVGTPDNVLYFKYNPALFMYEIRSGSLDSLFLKFGNVTGAKDSVNRRLDTATAKLLYQPKGTYLTPSDTTSKWWSLSFTPSQANIVSWLGYTPANNVSLSSLAFSGVWTDILSKPSFATVATSGAYGDLSGLPTLFNGAYSSLTGKPTLGTAAATATTDYATASQGTLAATALQPTGNGASLTGVEKPLTFNAPLSRSTNTISLPQATNSVDGYLSATDRTTFNAKQSVITLTTTGTGAATFSSNVLNIPTYSAPTPSFGTTPSRVLSTNGTSNTYTISSTRVAFVTYTINFAFALTLTTSNGYVELDYSTDGGTTWIIVGSASNVYTLAVTLSGNTDQVLSGFIPANALVRLYRINATNVTVTAPTTKQNETLLF